MVNGHQFAAGASSSLWRRFLIRPVQILAASHANLIGDLQSRATTRTGPSRLETLPAVEERGDQARDRNRCADQEPHEKRAALDPPDCAGRQSEEEHDHYEVEAHFQRPGADVPRL